VGAGLGASWGDSRVPVNTGPSVRIVPAPGTVVRGAQPPSAVGPVRPVSSSRGSVVDARRAARGAGVVGDRAPGATEPPGAGSDPDNADDVGERRWIGGTIASRRGRPSR